jgi:hypothetical protein
MIPPPSKPTRAAIEGLAERVERERGMNNALDVLAEIALFEPCKAYASIRANAAGTKTICTDHSGRDHTFWARDYTISAKQRRETAKLLRARAASKEADHG